MNARRRADKLPENAQLTADEMSEFYRRFLNLRHDKLLAFNRCVCLFVAVMFERVVQATFVAAVASAPRFHSSAQRLRSVHKI